MKDIVIFHFYIPKIGGIESAVYNLSKVLSKKHKVTIAFVGAENNETIFKYGEVVDIIKLDANTKIECDTLLIASNHQHPRQIKAKRVLQWIHSDYEKYKIKLCPNKVDQYISVSKHAGKIFKKLYGYDSVTIQNILDPDFKKPEPIQLRLVTNSRISPEKGFKRMLDMANGLREANISFEWQIFGDNSHSRSFEESTKKSFKDFPEVIFFGFKEDIRQGLVNADYLVQLSDFEGCPYSVLEALSFEVPCILTDFPSAFELIEDGKNGYIFPMNMKGIDYQKLVEKKPNNFTLDQSKLAKEWEKII